MELIAKAIHAGKTQEAITIVRSLEGNTLFVSNEERSEFLAERINAAPVTGKVIATNLTSAESVKVAILGWAARGVEFDTIVLDVGNVITCQEWFKLALMLEDNGVYVIGTQQLIRHGVKSKETLIATK